MDGDLASILARRRALEEATHTDTEDGGPDERAPRPSDATVVDAAALAAELRELEESASHSNQFPGVQHAVQSSASPSMDAGLMSSSSYFRPYTKPQAKAPQQPRKPEPAAPTPPAFRAPFPQSRGTALQHKLHEVSGDVTKFRARVQELMQQPQLSPPELAEALAVADEIQMRIQLPDAELQSVGWPTEAVARMRQAISCVEQLQQSADDAKEAIGSNTILFPRLLDILQQLLTAWCQMGSLATGRYRIDLGVERRVRSSVPMVSALLDQAVAHVRKQPDTPETRRYEVLLRQAVSRPELQQIGVTQILSQSQRELAELKQVMSKAWGGAAPGVYLSSPEVLWKAVTDGDTTTVEHIIKQGGLVSGCTKDPQGHSALWDAVAFHRPEVAKLLLRSFPPDTIHGVDLAEVHPRNGNTLLHMLSSTQVLLPGEKEIFKVLFKGVPRDMRIQKNRRGQTFAHIAGASLNFWVLSTAVANGLEDLFTQTDQSGWSPFGLLRHQIDAQNIASELPVVEESSQVPNWCPLGFLEIPEPGLQAPFADVIIEFQDSVHGHTELHGHRVVLATGSSVWHEELKHQPCKLPESPPRVRLDADVFNNSDVVLFALRFLYTGDMACPFSNDGSLLLQLAMFCIKYSLPAPLRNSVRRSLLLCLHEPAHANLAAPLQQQAQLLGLSTVERRFVARRLLGLEPRSWRATFGHLYRELLAEALMELDGAQIDGLMASSSSLANERISSQNAQQTMSIGTAYLGAALGTGMVGTQPLGSGTVPGVFGNEPIGTGGIGTLDMSTGSQASYRAFEFDIASLGTRDLQGMYGDSAEATQMRTGGFQMLPGSAALPQATLDRSWLQGY